MVAIDDIVNRSDLMVFIAVYEEKCVGCGFCVDTCQNSILELKDSKCFPSDMNSCKYCMDCVASCDYDAIKVFI
ncbi:4Fe-4S binding protein [Methanolobus sp. ZRKC2]|uniref:4Fe-4S binding protein n=1 Tax=Methanolobus sp. ZRKC2 TaxID=3125783 RepID=UPI00324FED27